ncbi:MAG: hypothetical protein AAF298_17665, partial [Cyanobacteria bacterium P01_A01_bin.40]
MLEGLDVIDWENLESFEGCLTAFDPVTEIPNLLRKFLSSDPEERSYALGRLYENLLHQGTRFSATPYVIPFIIELCSEPSVPNRASLLYFWSHAITGYFSIRQRPTWGDGETIYFYGKVEEWIIERGWHGELHQIYQESLKGKDLLYKLLNDGEPSIRAGAVWVLAAMPTIAESSVPKLAVRFEKEEIDWISGGIAFALGELEASTILEQILTNEQFSAIKCITACQLARIAPQESLIEPLLEFVSQPIEGYQYILGAGGRSTDDAAFAIAYLPRHIQQQAIPAICQRLKQARGFATMPLVTTLLSAAFEKRNRPLTELTDIQNLVLSQMLMTDELWSIGNLIGVFESYGLPDGLSDKKERCAKLVGIELTPDNALTELRSGLVFAEMNFLPQARESILKAIEMDAAVFERVPTPAEGWLLYAKAFAECDPQQAVRAFRRAYLINPA